MSVAIQGVPAHAVIDEALPASGHGSVVGRSHPVEVADRGDIQPASLDHQKAFADAVARSMPEVAARQESEGSFISSDLSRRVDGLSADLTAWQPNMSSVGQGSSHSGAQPEIASLTGQMKNAYGFAIETTLLSHGSTESTKIFNTLLKGQ